MDVLFDQMHGNAGDLGIITLNRQSALNSLNPNMVIAMYEQLQKWEKQPDIKAVVIRASEGRAFCAGGDLRLVYQHYKEHSKSICDFFRDEYKLNRYIYHYPKPYIAFLDGITMGGGVGISIHGSHRIATERTLFAMPETGIGFFTDIGGTYFLPRIADRMGYYLGLTGARIGGDDCVGIGIAGAKVASDKLARLLEDLAETAFSSDDKGAVTQVIAKYEEKVLGSELLKEKEAIRICFSGENIEEMMVALRESPSSVCQKAAAVLLDKSPTSLKVTLSAFKRTASMTFNEAMEQEYCLVRHFVLGHDFIEGIRAVLIDKDLKPVWEPGGLGEVTGRMVEGYFL